MRDPLRENSLPPSHLPEWVPVTLSAPGSPSAVAHSRFRPCDSPAHAAPLSGSGASAMLDAALPLRFMGGRLSRGA